MKKFISAVMALAMTVGMMASMNVAHAEEVTPTVISTAAELQTALADGGNYKLADDISEIDCTSTALSIKASVVLDLNDKTVKTNSDGFNLQNISVNCEIKNGRIESAGNYAFKLLGNVASSFEITDVNASAKQAIVVNNADHTVTISDSTFSGGTSNGGVIAVAKGVTTINTATITNTTASGIKLSGTGKVVANNVTVNATGTAVSGYDTSNLEINGGTYTATQYVVFWKSGGSAKISNSTLSTNVNGKGAVHLENESANITFNNSNVENTCTTANKNIVLYFKSGTANINGGNYSGVATLNDGTVITGGTFSFDPTSYVDTDAYTVTEADGTYTVAEKESETDPVPEISAVTAIDDTVIEGSDGFGKLFTFDFKHEEAITADKISVSYDGTSAPSLSDTTIAANSEVVFGILVSSTDKAKIEGIDTAKFSVSVAD